jgi:3-oxoacyl-[acyl-carrier-protein] synthase II
MRRRRVKITGIGPVTPAGIGREAFWRGIQEPISRVRVVDRFPGEAGAFVGAEVQDFDLRNYLPNASIKRTPRHTQFAIAAAILAAESAGLDLKDLNGQSTVVAVGASLMDFGVINKTVEVIAKKGPIFGLPSSVFSASVSSIGGAIGQLLKGPGRSMAFQSACCSGVDAVGHAAGVIERGEADFAICGGTEAPLYFHPMYELKQAGLAPGNPEDPEQQCRPFDLWRTTGVIGEGAALFILEPEESPRPALGYISGYAYASDSADFLGVGLALSMRMAISNAGLQLEQINAINAWGPGHRILDSAEAGAIRDVFGPLADQIPAFSIKGAIGNPLGAAGAIQIAASLMGFAGMGIPPTVNWKRRDPSCALCLNSQPMSVSTEHVIVNTHGLSGTNATLVLSES